MSSRGKDWAAELVLRAHMCDIKEEEEKYLEERKWSCGLILGAGDYHVLSTDSSSLEERPLLPSRVFSFEIWDGKEGTHGSKPVGSCFKSEPFLNPAAL